MQLLDEYVLDSKDKKIFGSEFKFDVLPVKGYELVVKITNDKTNLKAIVAIHSTALGPSLGGIRIYPYSNFESALEDVLRLSKGMTFKSAIAEVGLGGGKTVIMADPKTQKSEELLESFGEVLEYFKGKYIGAEDMGCTTEDARIIRRKTKYIVGLPHEKSSGNPARFTAWGTFRGIQSIIKKIYGSSSLEGKSIAVQGLGSVGSLLVEHLFWAGAELFLHDIDENKARKYARKCGAKSLSKKELFSLECDVLSPCALGGVVNEETIPTLQCKGIAGCANNQLLRDEHAKILHLRNILYAPDFVINSGGLLNVVSEIEELGYVAKAPRDKTHHIYDTLLGIYEIAERNNMSTQEAANALAEYRIRYGIGKRMKEPVFHHTID